MTYEECLVRAVAVQKKVFALIAPNRKEPNSFDPEKKSQKTVLSDGTIYCNDICYGETFPNSYLDIWYASDKTTTHPTLVYAHGGGYLFGDKAGGDPLSDKPQEVSAYFRDFCKRGFNVVSVNYCFAPEYKAPAQIVQFNEALDFLNANSGNLGIDTDRIVLMGSSAGANFIAVEALAICNKRYAEKLKIRTSIGREQLKALLIDEPSLDWESNVGNENLFALCAVWLGTDNVAHSEIAELLDVAKNIDDCYAPSYIVASNMEPQFYMSGQKLKSKLNEIGCDSKLFYVTEEEKPLAHGFMSDFPNEPFAKQCYTSAVDFIGNYIK